mgnify:CR=1 FL=1|tara:strand:+ start:4696 stop:5082 length:387 start_codon:yes stop_codon:yes gene_type:complete
MESIFASGAIGAILVAVAAIFRERNMRRKHKTERYQSDFQIGQRLRDELRTEMDRREQEYQADRRELEARITALEKEVERCHEERRDLQSLVVEMSSKAKPPAKKPAVRAGSPKKATTQKPASKAKKK